MLAQYLYLFRDDVTIEPTQPHQVTGKRPAGNVRPYVMTAPDTVRSIWQLEAYAR